MAEAWSSPTARKDSSASASSVSRRCRSARIVANVLSSSAICSRKARRRLATLAQRRRHHNDESSRRRGRGCDELKKNHLETLDVDHTYITYTTYTPCAQNKPFPLARSRLTSGNWQEKSLVSSFFSVSPSSTWVLRSRQSIRTSSRGTKCRSCGTQTIYIITFPVTRQISTTTNTTETSDTHIDARPDDVQLPRCCRRRLAVVRDWQRRRLLSHSFRGGRRLWWRLWWRPRAHPGGRRPTVRRRPDFARAGRDRRIAAKLQPPSRGETLLPLTAGEEVTQVTYPRRARGRGRGTPFPLSFVGRSPRLPRRHRRRTGIHRRLQKKNEPRSSHRQRLLCSERGNPNDITRRHPQLILIDTLRFGFDDTHRHNRHLLLLRLRLSIFLRLPFRLLLPLTLEPLLHQPATRRLA